MKKILSFILLIISLSIFAQVPTYYNDVNLNQTGIALKNALAVKIIATHHTNLSYTPGVWDALKQADVDLTDNSKVVLLYGYSDTDGNYITDRTRSKDANGGNAGTQWNREHTYPKSLGNPNLGTSGPGSDVHHLRATDISFNSQRSSKKFVNGSGNAGDVSGGWYPGDEWKGDVARMMLYTYLRYGNQCLPTGVAVGTINTTDSNMVNLLLEWNAEDPVSNFEKQRNLVIEGIQGNRNPFIDNPAFATQIWGGPQAENLFENGSITDTEKPSTPSNLTFSNVTENSVDLSWNPSTDNSTVVVYDIYNGNNKITTITTTSYKVTGLNPSATYAFYIKARDAANNISNSSNTVNITTSSGNSNEHNSSNTSDLLISEYVEGSSNNKALEIANFTGNTVDLSLYSLKKASNGGANWSNTLPLNGELENGNVYVIVHANASSSLKNKAQKTDTSVLSFNGNDAIALFKGNILIDLIGNPTSSATFAQDKTLRRNANIISPNTTYTPTEWSIFPKDDFSKLGSHDFEVVIPTIDTQAPTAPTTLVASNITQTSADLTWSIATDDTAVIGYEIYINNTKTATVVNPNYTLTNLSAGTTYTLSVRAKDATNNLSPFSNSINITTQANDISYCDSKGNNSSYEYIDNVAIGGISNSTMADEGYGDFTNKVGSISYGNNTIVVSAGFSGSSYTEYWRVWIDFNKNGSFESTELVASGSSSNAGNLYYNFSVPSTALKGLTRMRVSMKWDGAPTPCETFSYGEVEDYTVNIGGVSRANPTPITQVATELGNEFPIFDASLYPNPSTSFINIKLKDNRTTFFKITNILGEIVKQGIINKAIDVQNLKKGTYIIEINDKQRSFTKKFIKK
ncbi:endonuclease [Tenacibaculum maritimum]|uniref:endonuclease n=1 Tax=Tenacibaculum maritimum TaxID=107401 RepID=UPI0038761033